MKYKMLFLSFFITTNLFAGLINDVQKNQIKEHDPDAKNPLELLENHEDISTNDSTKLKTILNNENFSNEDSPIKLPGDDDFVTEKIDISLKNEFDEKISDFSETPGSTIYIYVFVIYLLLNFLVYNYVSSLRWFAIAPPYEFGLKIERTDAQELTKKQKFKRLNVALFWFSLFYLLGT